MSELQIGILMGLNGLIIVIIEMVLIFYLESKNTDTSVYFPWTYSDLTFFPGIYFSANVFLNRIDFGYPGYVG